MRPIITTLFLLLLQLLGAQTELDSISLDQLRGLATQHALGVTTARLEARLAALDQDILRARTRPRLALTANLPNYFSSFSETTQPDGTVAFRPVTINNSSARLQLSQPLTATGGRVFVSTGLQRFDDFENDFSSYNGTPIRVGLDQPLFGFNPWKWDRRIIPLAAREAEQTARVADQRAAADATALFFDLLQAQQSLRIAMANRTAGERLLEIARERYALGKITRGDLVQIELELTAAGQNQLGAERGVAAASQAIYAFLGWDYGGQRMQVRIPDAPPPLALSREAIVERMLAERPEVLANLRRQLEAQRDIEQTRRELGPQLNLQASLGLVRSDVELPPIYQNPQTEQIVSLQMNVPILDWGERRRSVEQAETLLELTQVQNERNLLTLRAQAELLLVQLEELDEELRLAQRIRELADERFNISRESYLLGSIPLTELTLAQQYRDQLARAYLASLSAYWRVWAELKALVPGI